MKRLRVILASIMIGVMTQPLSVQADPSQRPTREEVEARIAEINSRI